MKKKPIITVAHSKGGSRKSTTAWHLLGAIARKHEVVLIDTDTQKTLMKNKAI